MSIYDRIKSILPYKSGIYAHHAKHTKITMQEWNTLWNKLYVLTDELGTNTGDLIEALLAHADGTVSSTDEDREGRHGLKVTDPGHVLMHWWNQAWHAVNQGWTGAARLWDVTEQGEPPEGEYGADARSAWVILRELINANERQSTLSLLLQFLKEEIARVEALIPPPDQRAWMDWQSYLLIYVADGQPSPDSPISWDGKTVLWFRT